MKKHIIASILVAIVTFFSFTISNFAFASEIPSSESQALETNEQVKIIGNNLSLQKNKNGIYLVSIKDRTVLATELNKANSSISISDVEKTVNAVNNQLIKENGKGQLSDLLINNLYPKYTDRASKHPGLCSAVIGGAGLAHSTLYGAAAWGLGVTGPSGWIVGAGIGAIYYLGSLMC
ncbi:hypothetical protein J2Z60_000601 [Lactobacillus colini]|uniref:Uncharacterized protein n=1 Tax=Lactobacillus colini TaxID=1819254 RepID=A0ABS4MDI0_9LACO|nr:hypothetical protein [Lactobacillus colini]MBP2057437.1 hypothetical protein [Lactobacillus colini]